MIDCSAVIEATSLATIVAFRGDCDVSSKRLIVSKLSSCSNAKQLIIDLSEVHYLDSVVLAALMDVVRKRRTRGQFSPIVVASSPFIRKIFTIAGMDLKLNIEETTLAATQRALHMQLGLLG